MSFNVNVSHFSKRKQQEKYDETMFFRNNFVGGSLRKFYRNVRLSEFDQKSESKPCVGRSFDKKLGTERWQILQKDAIHNAGNFLMA